MAQVYRRHVRHSHFDRVRHGNDFKAFLSEQAARLYGVPVLSGLTYDNTTNTVTSVAHGLTNGDGPFVLSTDTALPTGLTVGTLYWINAPTVDTFTLHASLADATAGTNIVPFTDNGTGTQILNNPLEALDIFTSLLGGKTAEQISLETDPANL